MAQTVVLHAYDLSEGLAEAFSEAVLGRRVSENVQLSTLQGYYLSADTGWWDLAHRYSVGWR